MLQPARTKYRKAHKGRIHGVAERGATINFGSHGYCSFGTRKNYFTTN